MPTAKDVFVRCDELNAIPSPNRNNYLFELEWLANELPESCRLLQVGSMDGWRAIRLLEVRPDLEVSGLEIEDDLVQLATQNVASAGMRVSFFHGDITSPPKQIGQFDRVICLNNTLGFITDVTAALKEMRLLAPLTIVSVYGEKFDNTLAADYFGSIGLVVAQADDNWFVFDDFSRVRRFSRAAVESWGGTIHETPLGYIVTLSGTN